MNIIDYDTRWKELIEDLFEDFLAYFMPSLYQKADLKKGVVFLDEELYELVGSFGKKGLIVTDKLAKIALKDGSIRWLVIHIEIQASDETKFSERMFVYFSRLYEKFGKHITALAVYTGAKIPKNHQKFSYELEGTNLSYQFNTFIAKDADLEQLLASANPFAMAVLACRYLQMAKKDGPSLYRFKLELIKLALEKDYPKERLKALIKFIDYLIELPKPLEKKFKTIIREKIIPKDMSTLSPEKQKSFAKFADAVAQGIYGKESFKAWEKELKEERDKALAKLAESKKQLSVKDEQLSVKDEQLSVKDEQLNKAIQALLKEGTFSISQIAEMTDVSQYRVRKIKKQLKTDQT